MLLPAMIYVPVFLIESTPCIALFNNRMVFADYLLYFFCIVLTYNLVAFYTGYGIASIFRLPEDYVRSTTIETGI